MEKLTKRIYETIKKAGGPLTTNEVVKRIGQPRYLVLHRLRNLAVEGKIEGKQTKKRGAWIWWVKTSY